MFKFILTASLLLFFTVTANATQIYPKGLPKKEKDFCFECCDWLVENYPEGPKFERVSMFGHRRYLPPWDDRNFQITWNKCKDFRKSVTPIPGTFLLLGTGLVGLGIFRRRKGVVERI